MPRTASDKRETLLTLVQISSGFEVPVQGKFDLAIPDYEEAIRLNPKDSQAQNNLANSLSGQGKLDEARMIVDHPDLDLERGWLAYTQHHYEDAVHHFRAAGANGALPDLFVPQLVTALLRLDQVDAAKEAAAAAPRTSTTAAAVADIQVHQGSPERAIRLLVRAGRLARLPAPLRAVAAARLRAPTATLSDLARRLDTTKWVVRSRLRRLVEEAEA